MAEETEESLSDHKDLLSEISSSIEQGEQEEPSHHNVRQERLWIATPEPSFAWTIDYRFRALCNSEMSYDLGYPNGQIATSRIEFPLNSCWHGLRVGLERPNWNFHGEWMTPQQGIDGRMKDYDWRDGRTNSFTDLGYNNERWTEGQMVDIGLDFKLTERFFTMPIEVWPTVGFRWQRFDVMCYDLEQVKWKNVWQHDWFENGDIISYNQQYYIGYIGGQLRSKVHLEPLPPIDVTLQGDWGYTWGFSADHHIARGDLFVTHNTQGGTWHVGVTAEAPITRRLSVGVQADYLGIRTHGTGHWSYASSGQDNYWTDGESDSSHQTWLTAFLRFRI